jgi:dolichyl-phosphate-mannose--protein O-mannosyl transferase
MELPQLSRPALRWRIADTAIRTLAWCLYLVPFLAMIIADFGYKALVAAVFVLPAAAYALRYLFKGDEVASDGVSYAQQAARYQIGEATRGTAFGQWRGR